MNNYLDTLNPRQREAVETVKGLVLIMAGAGSGKTKALTCRIAYMLEQGIYPNEILAITFTNKAAQEIEDLYHNIRWALLRTASGCTPFIPLARASFAARSPPIRLIQTASPFMTPMTRRRW